MGHVIRLESERQFADAIQVLNELPGTWHSRGTEETTELMVLDSHYQALVKAGVIAPNGRKDVPRGKKATGDKNHP